MRRTLRGKVVCITGAASGIGEALASRALREGARVAGIDIDAAGLQRWSQAAAEAGTEAMPLPCDVTDEAACAGAISQLVAKWCGLDLLANCAGITHRSLLADTSCEVIRRVMRVNFFGAVHCTRAALPHLLKSKGVVVAVSSVAGFAPLIGRTGYAASKHALHGFFDTLRSELRGTGADVVVVCPSYTETPLDSRAMDGDGRPLQRQKPTVGRVLTADEVAGAILAGVRRRKHLVLVSPTARAAWWVSRTLPGLYTRIMLATHRSEFSG